MATRDPINPTDDDARALAAQILADARYGALAVNHPETGAPYVARVACLWTQGALHMLISTLSTHTQALHATPDCAVLVGEPGQKGDPLTHPRMTISGRAALADKALLRNDWLAAIPKAQLYYDFTDFLMFRLAPQSIDLNGGFGKAYRLTPPDLK
jgi:putative heme iron utilization protein